MNNNRNLYSKLRAVPYNRVSTDELVQKDALEVQIQESIECIEEMGWIMVDQYIDEGKSGTVTKRRDEYKSSLERYPVQLTNTLQLVYTINCKVLQLVIQLILKLGIAT